MPNLKYDVIHSESDGSCEYLARWKYDENLDKIDFVIKSTNVGKWTGIGFSETPQMVNENIHLQKAHKQ